MASRTINIPATTNLDADELTSGTVPFARLSTGTGSTQVAAGDHTHTAAETSSYTAATAPVINTSNDDVLTGDFLRVDIDGAGTGAKGLIVMVTLQPV